MMGNVKQSVIFKKNINFFEKIQLLEEEIKSLKFKI